MAIVTLRLPDVKAQVVDRPSRCPHCHSSLLQGWGWVSKPLRDPQLSQVSVRRFRCCECERTFRHYPEGVSPADQSQRLQHLAALAWVFGLSLRKVTAILNAFGLPLCHMTVWRDVQALASTLRRPPPVKIRVLGLDGFYARIRGVDTGMIIAVDLGSGQPVALVRIDEKQQHVLIPWLRTLTQQFGVEVIVSDDLNSYFTAAEYLGLQHQICRFHNLRWVSRLLKSLHAQMGQDWDPLFAQVRRLLDELPADGAQQIYQLYRQIRAPKRIRDQPMSTLGRLQKLLLRLSDNWHKYRLYLQDPAVPATNNATERLIGRWRTRSRSVRGFKTWPGLVNAFELCAHQFV